MAEEHKNLPVEIIAKSVTYRYIFEDLNGLKTPSGYIEINCLNPALPKESYEAINNSTGIISDAPQQQSFTATEVIKQKVCTKYVKF